MTKVAFNRADGRQQLRAKWPPNRVNTVTVHMDEKLYTKIYEAAKNSGTSMAAEIKKRLNDYDPAMGDMRLWHGR